MTDKKTFGFTSTILHSDRQKTIEHGSLHKPVHHSVAYGYSDARDLAAVFQGKKPGYRYGRQGNPTVSALEEKVTRMEDGYSTLCFATGMAAVGALVQGLLRSGDHVISSSFLFGNTNSLWQTVEAQGMPVSFVDATDVANVERAITPATRMVFVETIANPRTQIVDLERIGQLCDKHGILYVVDNTITSPYLFRPKTVGASIVINALTKYIGGHGNALGGSLTDTGLFDWNRYPNIAETYKRFEIKQWGMAQLRAKALRDFGASLGPEAAHHLAVGAETMALRVERQSTSALALTTMLAKDARVAAVYYPGLKQHSQHALASQHFKAYGGLFSFELKAGLDCFDYINHLQLAIPSSNLGDTRTLIIPVAHTIYHEMGAERRASMGIAESLIRVSTGIEETEDLLQDFSQALDAVSPLSK